MWFLTSFFSNLTYTSICSKSKLIGWQRILCFCVRCVQLRQADSWQSWTGNTSERALLHTATAWQHASVGEGMMEWALHTYSTSTDHTHKHRQLVLVISLPVRSAQPEVIPFEKPKGFNFLIHIVQFQKLSFMWPKLKNTHISNDMQRERACVHFQVMFEEEIKWWPLRSKLKVNMLGHLEESNGCGNERQWGWFPSELIREVWVVALNRGNSSTGLPSQRHEQVWRQKYFNDKQTRVLVLLQYIWY